MPLLTWQYQSTTSPAPATAGLPASAATPSGEIVVFMPTAINICLAASENISSNLRLRQASNIELPSLYKRAYMIAYQTDEVAIVRQVEGG